MSQTIFNLLSIPILCHKPLRMVRAGGFVSAYLAYVCNAHAVIVAHGKDPLTHKSKWFWLIQMEGKVQWFVKTCSVLAQINKMSKKSLTTIHYSLYLKTTNQTACASVRIWVAVTRHSESTWNSLGVFVASSSQQLLKSVSHCVNSA